MAWTVCLSSSGNIFSLAAVASELQARGIPTQNRQHEDSHKGNTSWHKEEDPPEDQRDARANSSRETSSQDKDKRNNEHFSHNEDYGEPYMHASHASTQSGKQAST